MKQYNSLGVGNFIIFKGEIDLTITRPPINAGATLSACSVILEATSPFIANFINSFSVSGEPNSLLIA